MSNEQGFQEVVKFVEDLGFYDQGWVASDMQTDYDFTFSREDAPTSFAFGVSPVRFDFFKQGDIESIERADFFCNPSNWPSEDFVLYRKLEGQPIARYNIEDLYHWLCETLDPKKYLRIAEDEHAPGYNRETAWKDYRSARRHAA
jgi:hypothetical protein